MTKHNSLPRIGLLIALLMVTTGHTQPSLASNAATTAWTYEASDRNGFAPQAGPTAPNIVVIMSDDLSLSELNAGISNGWMPNLKTSIIDQGTTFVNSFVADSICCPSRATFLTGQHSHNHHVLTNEYRAGGGVTKLNDVTTLATWLKDVGYRNGIVGKYLNGYGQNVSPSPNDDPTYIAPGWDDWQVLLGGSMYDWSMNDNGTIVTYGSQPFDYQTDVLAIRAADFIRESDAGNDAQPFFLWLTPFAPHDQAEASCVMNWGTIGSSLPALRHTGLAATLPLPQGPSFNESNVSDKPTWLRNNFPSLTSAHINCLLTTYRNAIETMMAVDDLIGTVVAELQATGELNDTVLVFTSDNGYLLGEHRLNAKQTAYEEAIRVPLFVRAPGMPGPQTAQQMTVNVDLAPTIVELAQATAGLTLDGGSFVPLLQDPGLSPWRTAFLIEHKKISSSVVPDYSAIRDTQYAYGEYRNGQRELYDLATDPSQRVSQHNNAGYGTIKTALKAKLNALKTCAGSTCWQ